MSKKVLVVDDDPVVRLLVNEFLSSQGYEVLTVESGTECMNAVTDKKPDVVVLDLLMPEMNGIEVLKRLRDNPNTASLPIVMMSSDFDTRDITSSYNLSADGYVQKPFGMRDILSAVKEVAPE
jgi:CheY-like chemotaxis protein